MRSMHYAVEQLDLAAIFPTPRDGNTVNERSSTVMECLKELKRSELNKGQQEAITSMLDPACTRVGAVLFRGYKLSCFSLIKHVPLTLYP